MCHSCYLSKRMCCITVLDAAIQYGVQQRIPGVKIGHREALLVEKLLWLLLVVPYLV